MTVQQMGYFLKLAEELNYTLVAKQFFITQPTLSRQIVNLEQELKVSLFTRDRNGVKLTEEGMVFYQKLKPIFQDLMKVIIEMRNVENDKEKIMICVQEEQLMSDVLTLAINKIRHKHPDLKVSIHRVTTEQLVEGIENGKYDVANFLKFPDMECNGPAEFIKVSDEPMYMAISKDLVMEDKDSITHEEFKEYAEKYSIILPSIVDGRDTDYAQGELIKNVEMQDVDIIVEQSGTPISIPVQVASKLGISICNKSNIFSIDPNIKIMEVKDSPCYVKGILYRKQMDKPVLLEFIKIVKEILNNQE